MIRGPRALDYETKPFFGDFGGQYVAEILRPPLDALEEAFAAACEDKRFWDDYDTLAADYIGRPTPLLFAENATKAVGGASIYIKLEGLANTGAHKINNAAGQGLLAKRMRKKRIIAETGAGQHGVATAAVCAKLGLDCTVYMGEVDMRRQRPNVFWMELYGAKVVPVKTGSKTLKDAINAALRDWAANVDSTYYLLGSALGPYPYPAMVKQFQSIIGREVREQADERGLSIDALVACVGGGSNAIGFFAPFLERETPSLVAAEAGGRGGGVGEHAVRMNGSGKTGIVHGYKSLFLLDDEGQVLPTHSVSAGLDYPGIGPELAYYGTTGRIQFVRIEDERALNTMKFFAEKEGIIFALESAHGAAAGIDVAEQLPKNKTVIINMSGRGDKDLFIAAKEMQEETWKRFLREESAR